MKQQLIKKIENQIVFSKIYGNGVINKVTLNNDEIYFDIQFNINGEYINKKFSATIAVDKNILIFEEEETKNVYRQLCDAVLSDEEKVIIDEVNDLQEVSILSEINNLIIVFKNKKSITLELLKYYDNFEFEKILFKEGFENFEKLLKGYTLKKDYEIEIVIMFSYISLKYYDGDLHSHIIQLFREYRINTEYKLTDNFIIRNGIYKVLDSYKKDVKYFNEKSYNAVPIIYCSVPHYRVTQLYKIAYDIYKKKLLFDDDVTDEQIESKVEECLNALKRKNLVSDSEKIKGTEYLMSRYTQSCIYSGFNVEALIKIISHCIRLIINHLTKHEDSFVVEAYYKEGYDLWVDDFENNIIEREKYEKSRSLSRPYFTYKNNEIYLYTGKFCLDDSFDPSKIKICIYSKNNLIFEFSDFCPNDIVLNDDISMGGYIIDRKKILLNCSPINELAYTIVCDGKEVYSSKDRLHRKVLFFNGAGIEVKPGTEYNGDIFVISKTTDSGDDTNFDEKIICKKNDFFISCVEVNSNDVFRFDREPFVFFKIKDPKLIGYHVPWVSFTDMENNEFKIIRDASILFQASCSKEDIYVSIDDNIIMYGEKSDIKYRIYLYSNEYNGLNAYLIKLFDLSSGFHKIKIYNSKSNKQIKNSDITFVIDAKIKKDFISKQMSSISYELQSNFLKSQNHIEKFDYEYGCTKKQFDGFVSGLGPGQLNIFPSTISYSLNNIDWFDLDKKLYLFELKNNCNMIYICGPDNLNAYIVDENSEIKKRNIGCYPEHNNKFKYSLDLSYALTLKNIKVTKIVFTYGFKNKYLKAFYRPFILRDQSIINYDKQLSKLKCNVIYEGNIELYMVIRKINSDDVLYRRKIKSGEIYEIDKSNLVSSYYEVHFVKVTLHMPLQSKSIFNRNEFENDAIISFPRCCIDDVELKYSNSDVFYDVYKKEINFKIHFEGVTNLKIAVYPVASDDPIYESTIQSDINYKIPINISIFDAYVVMLYKPTNNETVFETQPCYKSNTIKTHSYFLRNKLSLTKFVLGDESIIEFKNHWIYFKTIDRLNDKICLVGNLLGLNNKMILENMYIYPITINSNECIAKIYRKEEDKILGVSCNKVRVKQIYIQMN